MSVIYAAHTASAGSSRKEHMKITEVTTHAAPPSAAQHCGAVRICTALSPLNELMAAMT